MEPFKNFLSPDVVSLISYHLDRHLDNFDQNSFARPIVRQLPQLELKQRAQLIADAVHQVLPDAQDSRNKILLAMLHPDELEHANQPSDKDGICGWGLWPLTIIVGQHGQEDFEGSLELLKHMTMRGTSEFDVRPFLDADQKTALKIMTPWAKHENRHVRRLASEGTRPRLPWGMRLQQLVKDPTPNLPILFAMKDDPEEYVRRSVANHLNDIAKDHPDLVANIAHEWMESAPKPRQKLVRHACRSLIKQGHQKTLSAFGISPLKIEEPELNVKTKSVKFGSNVEFGLTLTSTAKTQQNVILDYVIHFKKANGSLSPKVFKWSQFSLGAGETKTLTRSHAVRHITTRKYYSGEHAISVKINGQDWPVQNFELMMDDH